MDDAFLNGFLDEMRKLGMIARTSFSPTQGSPGMMGRPAPLPPPPTTVPARAPTGRPFMGTGGVMGTRPGM